MWHTGRVRRSAQGAETSSLFNLERLEQSLHAIPRGLVLLALVTSGDVLADVSLYTWPLEVSSNKVHCSVHSLVSGYYSIVFRSEDVLLQSALSGIIRAPLEDYTCN